MLKLNILIFALCYCLGVCVGQYVQIGQCDDSIELQQNFDIDRFSGIWYELERTSSPEQNGDCAYFEISVTYDSNASNESDSSIESQVNSTISVYHNGVNNNFQEDSLGYATLENGTAKLTLNMSLFDGPMDFWVLSTDYDNYAITYSCDNLTPTQRRIYLWVFGRTRQYATEMIPLFIETLLESLLNIQLNTLQTINHSEMACYVLPVIEEGESILLPGQCDENMQVEQNFRVADFLGTWHEISSYYTDSSNGTCIRAEYSLGDGVVDVLNSQVINQTLLSITGTATVISTDNSAKLQVILNIAPGVTDVQDLWVISTDYTNYAISYSCVNATNNQKRIYSWILSRTRQLSDTVQTQVNQIVDSIIELNERYYITTDQTAEGCFFFPEPSDQPVVFRGQCDMDIPAMPGFDPVAYMGLWHNIELYPVVFQDGTCSNARYELIDGVVDVYNTQVLNETLDSIRGTAIIASDDGTAKLLVSFPIAGTNMTTTTDYWVLDTDYSNYSLVYSCSNLDDDRMQVSSWKLSRAKQLSQFHYGIIDSVMSGIPVLDQRYFKTESQTEADCFFYPTPELGLPVVFPGQCETDIAMQNFVLSQFVGTWYEVYAYPKEEQTGQCTSHTYTAAGNSQLNFVTSTVNNQFLIVSSGILTSTDSTGRLTITITSGGQTITIPFWIIATNYNDYALAYACVDRPDDFRAVWSWKLSRTQDLSTASEAAISIAIENIVVLDQRYYETIDQSDEACFYLPEFAPGEPIILPGQCDSTIRAIPNFNIGQFSGRWRVIESYPSDSQNGTCSELNFAVIDQFRYYMSQTQVRNQTLVNVITDATLISTDGSGILQISTSSDSTQPSQYLILDTDYTSYALVYACENLENSERRVWSWKLSRDNTLSNIANNVINEIINGIQVLNNRYYYEESRTEEGCFYFPDPSDNVVRFRGQCSENIPVVLDFQVARYLGLWHDIESYPMLNQFGSCPNAYYSLGDGVVDVYNTQVVSQALDTIIGTAEVASTDGSAKLNVTFNIQGVNVSTNYWVLDTDYDNYALVYSCDNIDDEYMNVYSWKLSRNKSLTNNSEISINAVINTLDILDDRYFVDRDQTEQGCFYYPEPQPNTPVIFPGQCSTNIQGLASFSTTQFAGLWYETASYAISTSPTSQCVDYRFSVGTTSPLTVESSSVYDQSLLTSSSSLIFASTDGSGLFYKNITIDGEIQTIPYWILATDYSDYALAYSCVNIDDSNRQIFSWKLSRTRVPSNVGNNAIDTAMANIDVLDNRYFTTIQQTDEACFYLPVLGPNEPVTFRGQCDQNIVVVQNFNASRYLGRWRLIETYHADFQYGTCNEATYSAGSDGSVMVYNTEVVNQELESITGSAVLATTDGSGKLLVTFPTTDIASEYWILDTDYDNYALVYSCQNIDDDRRRVWSWKMSRANELSAASNVAINGIVNSVNVLNDRYYQTVDRTATGCFYYPEPDNSKSVLFRGQCNESIPVVDNFAAARYLGLWYDLESYPMPFQFGTCPNAFYSLGDGVVDVYNTQVVDETLDIIHGIAEVVGIDGEAKLNVTFNVEGLYVSTNYWVLATDYDNFAYVYSCQNVDEEYMSVFSWKLSRSKSLTNAAVTQINSIMNSLDVLDTRYYVDRNQTTEGCFYYPEPQPDTPVVFPGQCDNNIQAVTNFNPGQFAAGLWHETYSYPYIQTGDCVNHQFAFGTSSILSVESSVVVNQTLSSTNSPVSLVSTDGSGRLNIQVTVDGQVQTIPFWVLATDYTDYALAYGCVNLNETFRQIYSWKLSRTRVPTNAGNVAINNAMTDIDVLDNRFYETIGQTDDACFYLPVLSPNDPVTFRGQCDQNIPVIMNFDAARYLGRWRLIETYYTDFQEGTCNEATYSAADDGSVIVYNTEVVNQQLENITGSAVLATTDGSGKLLVTFPTTDVVSEYWILDTDYDSYALVYSCQNIAADRRRVWSWKMSRTNSLTNAANAAINNVVNSINVLDDRYYQEVDRTDDGCFYYPTPDDATPVVFRGQCNMSIPAFPNFEPARYLGFWYDVQSYPAPFQTGTCNNAYYSLNTDGSVRVENTQVVDQLLETWIGRAVLDSDDGSAKLSATFNINGIDVTTKYWVLDTDYDNYALVYSCEDIDDERRSVFSWKLGRLPTLSAGANTAINNVIDTIAVLDQQYYVNGTHSEEDCFYYPDNNGGDVILNGQCLEEALVPVVTDFNVNLFSGTWHEVSRFPLDLQDGECYANDFTVDNANTLTLTQTNVNNERLESTAIQATVTDGRGVISINIDGVPFNNVYILGIDYNDYALAYGCRNVNQDQKQIFSWKLSRSRSGLSNAANTAINQLVSDNIDLWDGYYRETGQDNNACFYYPVFDELPSFIELPGTCPDNIRGVPNFNAAAYLGRWFEIARYPVTAQIGQCNRAEYSLNTVNGQDRVFVYNTEVNEELLFSQIGYADVASNDGSGQLNVEFIVDGVLLTANYYIIATDYDSYSLVYSCANLNNGNSAVSSWKLSRTPTLSMAASGLIANAIANTRGLTEEFYVTTSQSDEDCFYIPELNTAEAPLFRGQCEDITGVEGFDLQRYLGWWHEIERYPVDDEAGECRSSNYRQDGNTYQVVDILVENNEGTYDFGTVTATTDGRIRRTLPDGANQDIWVLATDYDTYALLYSCENVNSEYRRVWSAKHSRSRSLTQNDQDEMTPLIANNRVLYTEFYQVVDQSEDLCFHYPSITSGDIIIPGQCDGSIPVVQSFDINAFAGTWYHTAMYDDIESNTCLGSRYTVDEETGEITVLNFKVNSSAELEIVEGSATVQSTDGSARAIALTFPDGNSEDATVTTIVSVLATDYDEYALVYSCTNLNTYQRRVRAWQLSSDRTMSSSGSAAIGSLIQQRQELHQPYFKQIEQNEECEEPSSALLVKSSLLVLLLCAMFQWLL